MKRPAAKRYGIRLGVMFVVSAVSALALASVAYPADSVIATVGVGSNPIAIAVNPLTHMVYVANYYSDSVSMIDGVTDSHEATVPMPKTYQLGTVPIAVAVDYLSTPPRAFVVNMWTQSASVIDEDARSTIATMVIGGPHASGPRALAYDPTGGDPKLYFANLGSGSVSVYDAVTYQWSEEVSVGAAPRALGIFSAPGHRRLFVANRDAGTVSVLDCATDDVIATLPSGGKPKAIAVDPDTGYAYVSNESSGTVTVISDTDEVSATVTVGDRPIGVAVDTVGRRVFVANNDSASVSVIDAETNVVTATIPVGTDPWAIAFDQSERKAYVTNYTDGTVSIIDSTLTVQTVAVGPKPQPVAVDEGNTPHKAYVGNLGDRTVSVIDEPLAAAGGAVAAGVGVADAAPAPSGPTSVEIDALPGDVTAPEATFTGTAHDLRSPWVSGIRAVFYRFDGDTRWHRGEITGGLGTPDATWRVSPATTLTAGPHTLSVVAIDDRSTAVSTSDFGSGFVAAPIGSATAYGFSTVDAADEAAPSVSTPTVVPCAVPVTGSMRLSAIADDSATGASTIASAEYSLDGGTWHAMDAGDGTFDSATEACVATIGPFATPGVHAVVVRTVDAAGNTSVSAAGECAVIDPRGGSVAGTVRFGPVSPAPQPRLRVSAGYKDGRLRTQLSFSGPGVSFEATTGQWLVISGDLAVVSATGALGDGSPAVCTAWLADRTPAGRKDLARVRVSTVDGVTIYDSEPGAAFTSRPASVVTRGGVRVVAPRRAPALWTPSVRSR